MLKFIISILFLFITLISHAESAHYNNLSNQQFLDEISLMINHGDFEKANKHLQEKLNDKEIEDHYFRYELYLKKSLIYKSLFNYTAALENLRYAEEAGVKNNQNKEKIISRIKVERLFIYFDLQQEEEFRLQFSKITQKDINYLPAKTKAFYLSILGVLAMRENDFDYAEKLYDEGILLLEKEDPKHLPNIYRAKVALYGKTNNDAKANKAFQLGLQYANKYKVQLYQIVMYEAITNYAIDKKDYKNALAYQKKVSELRTAYNANNLSGKLSILDKENMAQQKILELQNERNKNYLFIGISIFLLLLIFLLSKILIVNKQKRTSIENENRAIRSLIETIPSIQDNRSKAIHLEDYPLSNRHLEIVNLIKQGKTNKEIGELLFISENTVKYHLKSIYEILGVQNRTELKTKTKHPLIGNKDLVSY